MNLSGLFQIGKAVIFMRIHKASMKPVFMRAGFSQVYATEQIAYISKGNFLNFPVLGLSSIVCVRLFVSGLGGSMSFLWRVRRRQIYKQVK